MMFAGVLGASPLVAAAWSSMNTRSASAAPADSNFSTSASPKASAAVSSMIAASASEGKIKLYSNEFYGVCAVGGILSCGLTHTAVAPMDVVK